MSFALFRKQPEPEMLSMPGHTKEIPQPPLPPKDLPKFPVPVQPPQISGEVKEMLELVIANQHAIYKAVQELKPSVLDSEELTLIPEEDKETYMDMKQTNPGMAEKLLAGYKASKKGK